MGPLPRSAAPSLWLHAVSLGEMTAAAPLVRALTSRYPQSPLLLTTATPTGRARARDLYGAAVDVRFLPYDTPGAVARFMDRTRPRLAILMETELWPNLFRECERRRVPLVLASARLSAKSVARYRRFGGIVSRNFLRQFVDSGSDPRGCRTLHCDRGAECQNPASSAISSSTCK